MYETPEPSQNLPPTRTASQNSLCQQSQLHIPTSPPPPPHPTTPINTAPCQTSCQKILFNPSFPISSPRTTCTIFSSPISSNNVLDTISHILDTFCVTCKPNFAAKPLRRRDVRVGGRGVPSGVRVDWRSIIPAISRWRALIWGRGVSFVAGRE